MDSEQARVTYRANHGEHFGARVPAGLLCLAVATPTATCRATGQRKTSQIARPSRVKKPATISRRSIIPFLVGTRRDDD
jgi:hypothetical protein